MKKSFVLLFAVLFFGFAAIVSGQSVQSGSWAVTPGTPGYTLDKNNGERTMTVDIDFEKPFETKPDIFLSVSQIDADKDVNLRYKIEAMSISRDGFTLKIRTWADSKIFSLSGFWLAHTE